MPVIEGEHTAASPLRARDDRGISETKWKIPIARYKLQNPDKILFAAVERKFVVDDAP